MLEGGLFRCCSEGSHLLCEDTARGRGEILCAVAEDEREAYARVSTKHQEPQCRGCAGLGTKEIEDRLADG